MSLASVSPLGNSSEEVWSNYRNDAHCFSQMDINGNAAWVAKLAVGAALECDALQNADIKYKALDKSVIYAMTAARRAMADAGWSTKDAFGINIGSSRGATDLFEKHHRDYLANGTANTLTSPTTTLGNIASWVAHDLQNDGPEISHSITCSTALHALLNGIAWLRAGMANKFLVGGSEAPLTPFTISQMKALKIYSRESQDYPSRALDLAKTANSMILGEAASVCCIEKGKIPNALAHIIGLGYATELLSHSISISTEADCFQKSMQMALKDQNLSDVDAVVMHAPGTIKGDTTEFRAIEKVFGNNIPMLTSNKWKTGHTFGASGALSIEMAVLMLQHDCFIATPFYKPENTGKKVSKILVNAVGFGGNAVSILLRRAV